MINLDSTRLEKPILSWAYWVLVAISIGAMVLFLASHPFVFWFFAVCLGLLVYGKFVEPWNVTVARYRFSLVEKPKAWVRVVYLSDLHAGAQKKRRFYQRLTKRVQSLKPDLLLLGGDFVEERAAPVTDLAPLSNLLAPMGRFFILGNHDYAEDPERIRQQMIDFGFTDATNTTSVLKKDDRAMTLVSLEDSWFGRPDVSLLKKSTDKPRLLFVHQPDNLLDVEEGDADVAVMGHTHGGQIRLPFIGVLRKLPSYAPSWLDRGLRKWKGMPVVISQGIGESDVTARLFCSPQIVVMELGI